jgi:hypothetical protein
MLTALRRVPGGLPKGQTPNAGTRVAVVLRTAGGKSCSKIHTGQVRPSEGDIGQSGVGHVHTGTGVVTSSRHPSPIPR